VSRLPPDYRSAFVERIARVLRDGSARGIRLVIAAQRATTDLQPALGLISSRLMLRHASRNDFVLAGGDGAAYIEQLPPGGGLWHGDRVQVVAAQQPSRPEVAPAETDLSNSSMLAIVSTRLGALRRILDSRADLTVFDIDEVDTDLRGLATSSGTQRVIIVGDVDDWQSRWGAINSLRTVADILFDACTPADFRVLTRSRELPPPLSPSNGLNGSPLLWRLEPDGRVSRARLPPPPY
jgi:S-DNA-T family DNA segregation ATPase FtsK/SpoIIIE